MIDVKALKKLYRSGITRKVDIKITFLPETISMVDRVVGFGKGRNGSALIELSTRFLITMIGSGEDIDQVSTEIKKCFETQQITYLINNLKRLIRYLES